MHRSFMGGFSLPQATTYVADQRLHVSATAVQQGNTTVSIPLTPSGLDHFVQYTENIITKKDYYIIDQPLLAWGVIKPVSELLCYNFSIAQGAMRHAVQADH